MLRAQVSCNGQLTTTTTTTTRIVARKIDKRRKQTRALLNMQCQQQASGDYLCTQPCKQHLRVACLLLLRLRLRANSAFKLTKPQTGSNQRICVSSCQFIYWPDLSLQKPVYSLLACALAAASGPALRWPLISLVSLMRVRSRLVSHVSFKG